MNWLMFVLVILGITAYVIGRLWLVAWLLKKHVDQVRKNPWG